MNTIENNAKEIQYHVDTVVAQQQALVDKTISHGLALRQKASLFAEEQEKIYAELHSEFDKSNEAFLSEFLTLGSALADLNDKIEKRFVDFKQRLSYMNFHQNQFLEDNFFEESKENDSPFENSVV